MGDEGRAPPNGPFAKYRRSKPTLLGPSCQPKGGRRVEGTSWPQLGSTVFKSGGVIVMIVMWVLAGIVTEHEPSILLAYL